MCVNVKGCIACRHRALAWAGAACSVFPKGLALVHTTSTVACTVLKKIKTDLHSPPDCTLLSSKKISQQWQSISQERQCSITLSPSCCPCAAVPCQSALLRPVPFAKCFSRKVWFLGHSREHHRTTKKNIWEYMKYQRGPPSFSRATNEPIRWWVVCS